MLLPYALLPNIHWFVLGFQEQQFSILHNTSFKKQSGLNRYLIAGPNNVQPLAVPINRQKTHQPLSEVTISYAENWIKQHKQAWQTAYGKSPFFEYYDYRFWAILDAKPQTMQWLVEEFNTVLFKSLKIKSNPIYRTFDGVNTPQETARLLVPFEQAVAHQNIIPYPQVFDNKCGFRTPLSIIDILFNLGPLAHEYFQQYPHVKHLD